MTRHVVPWTIFAVFAAYVAASAFGWRATSRDGFDVATFGRLPVAIGGRVRPIDSVARMGLLQVRGTADVPLDPGGRTLPIGGTTTRATEWLLEVLVKPDVADTRRVFPIGEPALLSKLRLTPAPDAAGYFTFKEIAPRNGDIAKEANRIDKILPAARAPWERELVALRTRLASYERLKNSLQANSLLQGESKGTPLRYDLAALLATYRAELADAARVVVRRQRGGTDALDKTKAADMTAFARPFVAVSRVGVIAMIPPQRSGDSRDGWKNMGAVIVDSARTGRLPAPVTYLAAITSAFVRGEPATFNRLAGGYGRWLASNGQGPALKRARYESFYNLLQPYAKAVALYLVAVLFICASWGGRSATLYRAGLLVAALAIALHSAGLLLDMMLSGRFLVLSLARFIAVSSWVVAVGAFALERSSGRRRAMAIGAGAALITLASAYVLAPGGLTLLVAEVVTVPFIVAVVVSLLALLVLLLLGRARAIEAPAGAAPVPA